MIPIQVPSPMRIIAHRGASAYAPENTRPAFQLAQEMNICEVEVDAQLSSDGVAILCHDHTLERYGHGTRVVETVSSSELLALDMGAWFSPHLFANTPMMSLNQLLAEFSNDLIYHIELKGHAEGLARAVYTTVQENNLLEQAIFTSFSVEQLKRMRELSSDCRLGWLVKSFDEQTLDRARELDLFQLCPLAEQISESLVETGRYVVPEIRAWGINGSPQEIRHLIDQVVISGCDGMTLNWPDWVTK